MTHGKFEISGSFTQRNTIETFLTTEKAVELTWEQIVLAVCQVKQHDAAKCIGYKINEEVVTLMFEK
jgi:hypothetical protein